MSSPLWRYMQVYFCKFQTSSLKPFGQLRHLNVQLAKDIYVELIKKIGIGKWTEKVHA